jgi:hypothetical protein
MSALLDAAAAATHGEFVQAFVKQLHSSKQYWVPIVDPGIKVDPGYPAYDEGLAAKAFINDFTGKPYLGQVGLPCLLPLLISSKLHACASKLRWAGAKVADNDARRISWLTMCIWQLLVQNWSLRCSQKGLEAA